MVSEDCFELIEPVLMQPKLALLGGQIQEAMYGAGIGVFFVASVVSSQIDPQMEADLCPTRSLTHLIRV